jgi:ectoine hydroxylase-related dioxygenase (phytanoyl-CoA dioxygenase family)
MSTVLAEATPFTAEQTAQFSHDFNRDGFLHVPGVLSAGEVADLKAGIDAVFTDPQWRERGNIYNDFIALRLFETGRLFEEMLTREPIIGLMESLLGDDCHLIAQNAMRNAPGQAIDMFHVDDSLLLPIGEGMERHDARLTMPVLIINVMFPLTEIPSIEYGPTQYVPGSHYSGRHPDDLQAPNFEGRAPVSIFCRPGDMYFFNNQGWHRGAPNTSTRTRTIFGMVFGRRCMAQRFYPYMNYQLPQHIIDHADERRKRVLGFHAFGAYG